MILKTNSIIILVEFSRLLSLITNNDTENKLNYSSSWIFTLDPIQLEKQSTQGEFQQP
jgi:hypothetical protein